MWKEGGEEEEEEVEQRGIACPRKAGKANWKGEEKSKRLEEDGERRRGRNRREYERGTEEANATI